MQRALSMSESAGFQAPPELINAMELLSGELPYPTPDVGAAAGASPGEAHSSDEFARKINPAMCGLFA